MASLGYEGPLFDIFNLGESETIQLKDLIAAIEETRGSEGEDQSSTRAAGRRPTYLRRYFEGAAFARLPSNYVPAGWFTALRGMVSSDAQDPLTSVLPQLLIDGPSRSLSFRLAKTCLS